MTAASSEEKRNHLGQMLNTGQGLVMVHLDPRHPRVQVPAQFKGDPVLRLNIAYGFNLPSLDLDDTGVYAMLSFGGRRFGCNMPWESVFALTMPEESHHGVVWPEDLPPELRPFFSAAGVEGEAREVSLEAVSLASAMPAPKKAASLSIVPDSEGPTTVSSDDSADQAGDAPEPVAVRPRRPTLRIVQ